MIVKSKRNIKKSNRKGFVAIIAISFLLVLTIVSVLSLSSWMNTFTNGIAVNIETESTSTLESVEVEDILGDSLYISNSKGKNINITSLSVGGVDCGFSGVVNEDNLVIDVSSCIQNVTENKAEIVLITNEGVLSKYKYFKDNELPSIVGFDSCLLDGIDINHGASYSFYNSSSVPFGESCSSLLRTCNDGNFSENSTFNLSSCSVGPSPPLVFSSIWNTSITGSSGVGNVSLPLEVTGTYNFTIDWGDGIIENITTNSASHSYGVGGLHTINVTGEIVGFRFANSGDKDKIIDIQSWGPLRLGNNAGYFHGASNLDISATDELNTSGMNSFNDFFRSATSLTTPDFSSWNTTNITLMYRTFRYANSFNGNINNWDVQNVGAFRQFFENATSFNQSLALWDVSGASDMLEMFRSTNFNRNISNWNTSSVTRMDRMFYQANAFNQNLTGWDVNQIAPGNCVEFNTSATAWSIVNQPNMTHCI